MNTPTMNPRAGRPAAPPLPEQYLVTVFEAINETRRELYIGTSTHLVELLTRLFLETPPAVVAHWSAQDKIVVRCVEYSVAVHDVDAFVTAYVDGDAPKGWRVIRQAAPPAQEA